MFCWRWWWVEETAIIIVVEKLRGKVKEFLENYKKNGYALMTVSSCLQIVSKKYRGRGRVRNIRPKLRTGKQYNIVNAGEGRKRLLGTEKHRRNRNSC